LDPEKTNEMSISGEIIFQITPEPSQSSIPIISQTTPSPTPTPTSSVIIIYVESDDSNPVHIHYNFNKKKPATIVQEDMGQINRNFKIKKTYLRDVRDSKRRHT